MKKRRKKTIRVAWIARVLIGVCVIVAMTWLASPTSDSTEAAPKLSVWELNDPRPRLEEAKEFAVVLATQFMRMLPIGLLLPFAMPRSDGFFARLLRVFLPSVVVGTALAYGIRGSELGDGWMVPTLLDVALGLCGVGIGVLTSMILMKGPRAVSFVVTASVLGAGVGAFWLAGLAQRAVESEPLAIAETAVTSEAKREIVDRLKKNNPRRIPEGETRTLSLTPSDLNFLVAWAGSVVDEAPRSSVRLSEDSVDFAATIPIPRMDERYLNLQASSELGLVDKNVRFELRGLSVGSVTAPGWLLGPVSRLLSSSIQDHRVLEPAIENIQSVDVQTHSVNIVYGRFDPKGETLSRLFAGIGPSAEVVVAARAQLERLETHAGQFSGGDSGFGEVISDAFRFAAERSSESNPVVENQGAILALATIYGSSSLRRFAGLDEEKERIRRVQKLVPDVTIRGRSDWTKHFLLSAGLTVVSSTMISDAAGLLKEELDSDTERGGSGFSFGDLLADRAGTRFAWVATRDDERAGEMQHRLKGGFQLDDFFPIAEGLPEGIGIEEFERNYGGVGGERYRLVSESIDRRLQSCAAYR